ncbi:hypothetical protein F2Q70_00031033 [Brassica cretica]|uniref:Proteasome subunit beta n=1 Tax=Brassica cretica TaxID=69181 RepID=A0A8S9FEL8_BRACR|nr:hypothetical protein F2Q70_00031033 [Brassica cretica]
MSIFEYNGSAVVAMVGKNCFAIASDRRLGVQLQTIATDFQRISKIHDRVFIGLSGLATDVQTLRPNEYNSAGVSSKPPSTLHTFSLLRLSDISSVLLEKSSKHHSTNPTLPMSIFEYNGSAVVAMVGKNCFAIASDRRLGVQLQTIATDFQRISKIHDRVFIGLSGLATDVQTL